MQTMKAKIQPSSSLVLVQVPFHLLPEFRLHVLAPLFLSHEQQHRQKN